MAQVIRATFRRIPQIHHFDFLRRTPSPCITSNSERLSFVALPSDRRQIHFPSLGIRRRETLKYVDTQESEETEEETKSRNQKKREAKQALRLGVDLASFSNVQIKRVLRAASLEQYEEIYEAVMVAKRIGPHGKEGMRRQFNLIGKLIRYSKPLVLEALIEAAKEGDYSTIEAIAASQKAELDDEEEQTIEPESDEEEEEDDDTQQFVAIADKWFDGLVNKNVTISNEVYSISDVEFDRGELRRLVKNVQSILERQGNDEEDEKKLNAQLKSAQGALSRFLLRIAEQAPVEHNGVV